MVRIAVVEDEENSREKIRLYLQRYCQEHALNITLDCYEDGLDLVEHYSGQYDLLFCDIQMQYLNGMEAARQIREQDPNVMIIFITNLSDYAIQGYEVSALGYLLKPVNYHSFCKYFGRAVKQLEARTEDFLVLRYKGGIKRINLSEVLYLDYAKHYISIHSRQSTERILMSMKELESLLEGRHFSKCNSGCIVNLAYVQSLDGNCVVVNGTPLTISRSRKKPFVQELTDYLGGEEAQ
ncbi:MAG: LytR/AlgR family response regulator transcription factor [Candidatus Onthomonas sp.]